MWTDTRTDGIVKTISIEIFGEKVINFKLLIARKLEGLKTFWFLDVIEHSFNRNSATGKSLDLLIFEQFAI
jgi:hypothetical protein